jgi:hypothetical protein
MSRPGFYNDNEYRAYPFTHQTAYTGPALPDATIVDCGIIMGLASSFDASTHSVWLAAITRGGGNVTFSFATNANAIALNFVCPETADEWTTIHAESASTDTGLYACDPEPAWEGYLVVGALTALLAQIANNTTVTYSTGARLLEPGRIQSLVRSYVHSLNVGNFSRVMALPPSECQEVPTSTERSVVINRQCMQGDIRFDEGYNVKIKQVARSNELLFSAELGAGKTDTSELCAHGSELELYEDEPADAETGFFSGGPACNQTISTINGVSGSNIQFVGGTGVQVTADQATNTIDIKLANTNVIGNCAG